MFRLGLHHIETLSWIHRLGSYSAAADHLNTTQSAISSRVKEMESRLKTRLFRKEGRRMVLTLRGRDLVTRSEPLLEQMNGLLLAATDDTNPSGRVSLGLGEAAAMVCLPPFLRTMSVAMPKIGWDITVDVAPTLRQRIQDGTLDIGVMAAPIDEAQLMAMPIGRVDITWMASPSLATGRGDEPANELTLRSGPVWSLPSPSYHYRLVESAVRAAGLLPSDINSCNHVQSLIGIVTAGAGIAMLTEQLVADKLANGTLVKIPLARPTTTIEFVAVRRHNEADPIVLRVFEQLLTMNFSTISER